MLVRYLGHLGSATLATGVIAVCLSFMLSGVFKEPLLPGALLGGAIMGYLVNRNMRDATALLVGRSSPGPHTFGTASLGRTVADRSAGTNSFLPLHFYLQFLTQ